VDIQALMGLRTKQQQESIPPERWGRFLAADDDGADLLERIIGRAGDAAVPDDYREPNHKWNDLAEVCDQLGQHEFGSVFADADERDLTADDLDADTRPRLTSHAKRTDAPAGCFRGRERDVQ
jgi:hypothetical protein